MIKLTATANIHYISPVIEIPPKNSGGQGFAKRELVLDDSWTKDGIVHPNYILIEFSGDKIAQLDNFAPGMRVTVEAYVNGREYNGRFFNTVKGMSATLYQPQQSWDNFGQYAPPTAPGGYPKQPQQPVYPQQPAYPQQPQYSYNSGYTQPPAPRDETSQGGNLGPDGLPFAPR